jgi:hypothetical protein
MRGFLVTRDRRGAALIDRSPRFLPAARLALVLGLSAFPVAARGRAAETVVSPSSNASASYRNDVLPLLSRAGCNAGACHGNASGKGGFRLSLRGDDPEFDLRALTREALGRRISTADPERSLVLLKPTGQVPHEGGIRFAADSSEARTLRSWIAAGARDDVDRAPRLRSIRVEPPARIIAAPAGTERLRVEAEFDNGSIRDVTGLACFDLSDPTLADVSRDGLVRAHRPCELTIAIRYLRGRGTSRLTFVADRPGFEWRAPPERNEIDHHVFGKLRALKVDPSPPAADSIFLRRAFLDAIGRLPTPEEARSFLADRDPRKRDKLVAGLVDRPEFADVWALKWADVLRNEEKTMGPKGVWVFERWLRDQFAADVPLDEVVRRIVAARGSTWTNPPSSFYRTNRDPMTAAETVAQVFLGVRLQCARCHNHPFDDWTQDDYYGLAAYFSNVKRKQMSSLRKDRFDKHEINGDEFVYVSGPLEMTQPRTGRQLTPRPPHGPTYESGGPTSALDHLAGWLTRDNRQFARNLANRVWFHLMGRGIVDPVDDFRESNPPSNPELLEALTDHLIKGGMRLRPLVILIMQSQTYQLGSAPNPTNSEDSANFSRATVRVLPAEVLLDAVNQVLGVPDEFRGAPRGLRATQLPGVAAENSFMRAFGKPERLLTCECERTETTTLAQAFQMINGEAIRVKLEVPGNRLGKLLEQHAPAGAMLDEIYLSALCRKPTTSERAAMLAHVDRSSSPREGWQDVAWAVLNSKEFLLRH